MLKQLLIMRHAKSSWGNAQLTDFQRPLNPRGLRTTPRMAEFIQTKGLTPDRIVSSTANRARMTAELFLKNCVGMDSSQLSLTDDFYHAPASVYLDFLRGFSEPDIATLMLVGHNPGLEDLVEQLSGNWETMPTAAIAFFELKTETWSEFSETDDEITCQIWRPKEVGIV